MSSKVINGWVPSSPSLLKSEVLVGLFLIKGLPVVASQSDCQEGYPHYNDKCMLLFDLTK